MRMFLLLIVMYNLFISHSWSYHEEYDRLEELLRQAPRFEFKNYSVSKDDPIHNAGSDRELREAIENQIKYASVVLILASVYVAYSKWINKEIDIAKKLGKPIVAVEKWDSERSSEAVKEAANETVKWNIQSIVDAIRRLARDDSPREVRVIAR